LHLDHQELPLLWRTFPEDRITLSEAVATQTGDEKCSLTTTEIQLTEGKHYWEVELLSASVDGIFIGISRPNLDPTYECWKSECTDGWFINADDGTLYGNGKENDDETGAYKQGDHVGLLLDLDNGSLRFFKNGVECGPGFPAGSVTGSVVHAVHMYSKDNSVQLLPNSRSACRYLIE
jgi:hypothetical protein